MAFAVNPDGTMQSPDTNPGAIAADCGCCGNGQQGGAGCCPVCVGDTPYAFDVDFSVNACDPSTVLVVGGSCNIIGWHATLGSMPSPVRTVRAPATVLSACIWRYTSDGPDHTRSVLYDSRGLPVSPPVDIPCSTIVQILFRFDLRTQKQIREIDVLSIPEPNAYGQCQWTWGFEKEVDCNERCDASFSISADGICPDGSPIHVGDVSASPVEDGTTPCPDTPICPTFPCPTDCSACCDSGEAITSGAATAAWNVDILADNTVGPDTCTFTGTDGQIDVTVWCDGTDWHAKTVSDSDPTGPYMEWTAPNDASDCPYGLAWTLLTNTVDASTPSFTFADLCGGGGSTASDFFFFWD